MKHLPGAAVALACLILAGPAAAGDYHSGVTLRCADCHIMHYSQSHGYNANGSGFYFSPFPGGPFHYLLRAEVNDLCLACHDNQSFAPDVLGINGGNSDIRLGGALNRPGFNTAGYFDTTGHTLDSTEVAPGGTFSNSDGLNCTDCHTQHGRSGAGGVSLYRNLPPGSGNSTNVTYAIGTNDLTKDVFERQTLEYDESKVDWNEPNNTDSAIAKFCAGCHNNFHGTVGSANVGGVGNPAVEFVRHPTGGVNIGAVGGGHSNLNMYKEGNTAGTPLGKVNFVKVMSETGVWGNTATAADGLTPTCISCHKGHGNKNAFGLIYRKGTGLLTEEGDSNGGQEENLCGQCHTQASSFALP
jgi:hypothetical protein